MSISASMVKELRERTGAGMMECKKALVDTAGDMDAAVELLRKSGQAKADKKSGRVKMNKINLFNLFKKKEPLNINLGKVGVIMSSDPSIESGINDKFNKKIVIYEKVEVHGNNIKWGKILDEIPYSEEEVINLIKIKEIPIVEKKLNNEISC